MRRIDETNKSNHPRRAEDGFFQDMVERIILPADENSVGRWALETPIGRLRLSRQYNGCWQVSALGNSTIEWLNLTLWLRLTGLSEIEAESRRELREIVIQAVERHPKTPMDLWESDPLDSQS